MQQFLGKKLAVIEFDFLEKMQAVDEWNDSFFTIFKWIANIEKEYLYDGHLHIIVLNDMQIFVKEVGEMKIKIYNNSTSLKPDEKKQLLVIYTTGNLTNQIREKYTRFAALLLQFLEEKSIENRIIHETIIPNFGDNVSLKNIVEILIGIKETKNAV